MLHHFGVAAHDCLGIRRGAVVSADEEDHRADELLDSHEQDRAVAASPQFEGLAERRARRREITGRALRPKHLRARRPQVWTFYRCTHLKARRIQHSRRVGHDAVCFVWPFRKTPHILY